MNEVDHEDGIEEKVIDMLTDYYTDQEKSVDVGSIIMTLECVKYRIIDFIMKERVAP